MLDDPEQMKILDKSDMLGILDKFPEQISDIVTALKELEIPELTDFKPNKIVVLGMGGSAIGGDILSSLLEDVTIIPIITVRGYNIPTTIDDGTLVFACSYSGNTEETLTAVAKAHRRRCKIIGITSGGRLEEFCNMNNLPLFNIPKGLPPRAAIAFLFFPLLMILDKSNIVQIDFDLNELVGALEELRGTLLPEVPEEENPGKILATKLYNGIPFIYGQSYLNIIALRWKTQLNENSKVIAMAGSFPEMNHNEIVGWSEDTPEISKQFKIILLRSPDEHPQVSKRIELTKKTFIDKTSNVFEVDAQGESKLTRMMTTLYLGDYISVYLALLRGVDPTPVDAIEELKRQLVE